ncbi:MAG: elongation factor 4 [Candidatus Yanofskybacteria bacterium RIFCSPHIGHO2_01_FULL_41_27]|uniref:Elongation factor 4 n=2 Tax=Candidatus Yanofskyibacteriota TaxID=1752733 RepID=A0A1F8HVC0_9BACT|nr:MAG: elongation factor 4 [Candidatus Yanofskybacteria bacterium RIFCSPHIGHO2_01_FULL_41_27]OGN09229.1 MAG: elongation factor 4 [Candidatus Yanofskybacteria bacterium RIFCSPHIGHO2_02_FULL_41_12]OGN20867.1 MAG: elongation factor 4 [Candidatus Yanofskybacteria bacterium RIFCSPLOWO2_01_FULL_41_33]OGN41501.1 MAG: elongation factor 4 [Candidatus Yanofskybacteria bacterium RIFOXYD1_FULL_42_10]
MNLSNTRNFCIIAHIDHGKSTLADRFLELTKTVEKRKMQEQFLDQMELERERGITIKLQPVRMCYRLLTIDNGQEQDYILNLIDTPGHVDFSYEVSRSLAAVEGAVLLVDASKGIQAQTLANLHLAQAQNLKIIPVINKIDLPNARTEEIKEELAFLLGIDSEDVLEVSAKNGTNIDKILEKIIKDVPPPVIDDKPSTDSRLRALIFDSVFDTYKGVIAFVRIFGGSVKRGDKIMASATGAKAEVIEAGFFAPALSATLELVAGNIGYIATGLKDPGQIRVGDTITNDPVSSSFHPLPGYKEPNPMVFASFFPENGEEYDLLKDALGKLKLTDASLSYEPESSAGLGRGFRLGFLGMLHVEIISERLKREFGLSLIISSPSVEYLVEMKNGEKIKIRSAAMLPDFSKINSIAEPIVALEILTPSAYMGNVMELVSSVRSIYNRTDYLGKGTVLLKYDVPLAEVITDFYDKLKSVSSGYASMGHELKEMRTDKLVRLDIFISGELVEPFSKILHEKNAYYEGRMMAAKLKETIPPQWFEVAIQAAIGGKIIARETIRARRKDVTGYLYGGDVTRKMKLLEKQKRGKKKMKEAGRVNLPQEVFLKMLKR